MRKIPDFENIPTLLLCCECQWHRMKRLSRKLNTWRTDEDQIGATYDELEWAMKFIETGIIDYDSCPDIDRQKEVLKIYKNRHNTPSFSLIIFFLQFAFGISLVASKCFQNL